MSPWNSKVKSVRPRLETSRIGLGLGKRCVMFFFFRRAMEQRPDHVTLQNVDECVINLGSLFILAHLIILGLDTTYSHQLSW